MKVYIGKYPRIFNGYIPEPNPNGVIENKWWFRAVEWWNEHIAEHLLSFSIPKTEPKYIKIDNHDVWNMSDTLAEIILPMLKKLREIKHGSPFVENEDVPETLWRNEVEMENEWDTDENWFLRWEYVLDKMIWSFEQLLREDRESQFFSGESDFYFEPCNDGTGCSEMKHGPNHTFEVDYDAQKAYEEEIKKGLMLFGKYYQNLWD